VFRRRGSSEGRLAGKIPREASPLREGDGEGDPKKKKHRTLGKKETLGEEALQGKAPKVSCLKLL